MTQVEVDEVLGLVGNVGTEVSAYTDIINLDTYQRCNAMLGCTSYQTPS